MADLLDLYKNRKNCTNPGCTGCSILEKPKAVHAFMDQEKLEPSDVLFLMDSFRYDGFGVNHLSDREQDLFRAYVNPIVKNYRVSAAVKCLDVREEEMSPNNMELCRKYLDATVEKVKPKLIFTCGNLAMKMLIKKSGITTKRGKTFEFKGIPVIPILHPNSVAMEPKLLVLFTQDVRNGYNKYILKKSSDLLVKYDVVTSLADLDLLVGHLQTTDTDIAVDIESTGLDFKKDSIMTIAISYKQNGDYKQVIIPYIHKESPFSEEDRKSVAIMLNNIFSNPRNKKILQNAKFDLKFLYGQGISFVNVWDTKLMSHFIREDAPKSLMDLVKQYFPEYLKDF
jgi:hypothetical protein